MLLDLPSSTAFSPPPILEDAERVGSAPPGTTPASFLRPARMVAQGSTALPSPATGLTSQTADALTEYVAKLSEQHLVHRRIKIQIEDRVRELRIDALRAGETFSEASLADFRSFLEPLLLVQRPSIFLLDNGNLRALWRNALKEQVGLQFVGRGVVQFVIFVQRRNPSIMSRDAGCDTFLGLRARIKAIGCDALLFG
jgi:hypothetical protein